MALLKGGESVAGANDTVDEVQGVGDGTVAVEGVGPLTSQLVSLFGDGEFGALANEFTFEGSESGKHESYLLGRGEG
jgi:hypothetical protein